MNFNKSLIINLFGNINHIKESAFEIHSIVIGRGFGSKIIENKELSNELNRNINRDIWINKCSNLTMDQIILSYNYLNFFYRKKNIYNTSLYVTDNKKIYNPKNVYNINNSFYIKEEQIENIIYGDYSKFTV